MPFSIIEADNIEVVHHIYNNQSTAKVMVRRTFPMHQEHDLIRTLQSQLEPKEYTSMLDMTKGYKADDLVLIAFVTMYDNQTVIRAKIVEQLIFHSFILMTKPSSTSDDMMKINYAWTSDAYRGATLDRLMHIGCIMYWKEPSQLTVDSQKLDKCWISKQLKWTLPRETAFDIMVRLYGYQPNPDNKGLINKSVKKTTEMTSDIIDHLRWALKPKGETPLPEKVKIPLALFTHYLSQRGHYITELAAQLFQNAEIITCQKKKNKNINSQLK